MITLTECAICNDSFNIMREHCPNCGSRRRFDCSHSYQPYCVIVKAQRQDGIEVVRALRSDIAFNFVTAA